MPNTPKTARIKQTQETGLDDELKSSDFDHLPKNIKLMIFSKLPNASFKHVPLVSKAWNKLALDRRTLFARYCDPKASFKDKTCLYGGVLNTLPSDISPEKRTNFMPFVKRYIQKYSQMLTLQNKLYKLINSLVKAGDIPREDIQNQGAIREELKDLIEQSKRLNFNEQLMIGADVEIEALEETYPLSHSLLSCFFNVALAHPNALSGMNNMLDHIEAFLNPEAIKIEPKETFINHMKDCNHLLVKLEPQESKAMQEAMLLMTVLDYSKISQHHADHELTLLNNLGCSGDFINLLTNNFKELLKSKLNPENCKWLNDSNLPNGKLNLSHIQAFATMEGMNFQQALGKTDPYVVIHKLFLLAFVKQYLRRGSDEHKEYFLRKMDILNHCLGHEPIEAPNHNSNKLSASG